MRKLVFALGILILVGSILVGCAAPAPTPTPTKAPAAAPATAPTKAPAAAPTQAPAAATKAPAPAPATATPAAAPKAAVKPLSPVVKVKVGVLGSIVDAGFFIPYAKGYFKEEGLDVELVQFATAALMIAPLGTGQLDAGGGGIGIALFNTMLRDIPLKIVADKAYGAPGNAGMGWLVRKDLIDNGVIKGPADLKGKTFAFAARGQAQDQELEVLLGTVGLTMDDIEVKLMSYPDQIPAFANKSIDVGYNFQPNVVTVQEQGLAVMWKPAGDIIPNHEASVILYAPSFAEKQPEAAKRFMVAYVRGVREYNDAFFGNKGKEEVIQIMTQLSTQKNAEILRKMVAQKINPDGYVFPESIKREIDWYTKRGDIKQAVPIDKAIDNQYVDYAIQRLGKYQQ
ncbi:MAG: ABC transporter substrate-binding protein [Chloroflexi bacterium]|nr:ABC transporter substrate-binding protein [Chloroflexota bacterium]